jgi:hypothetical protein
MRKFKYVYGDSSIEFSPLSTSDADRYFGILKDNSDPHAEEYVFNQITESKYELEDLPAGVIIAVIYAAIKISGVIKEPKDLPEKIEQQRAMFDEDIMLVIHSMIIRFMPSHTPDQLKTKTLNEIIELLVFAERVSGQQLIDIAKMRESLNLATGEKKFKKGIAGTSKEEIAQIKSIFDNLQEIGGPAL